jgi:hypothetical protein
MNYFAHGMRFLDRPYFLAGTALPDWLRVVDPKVRFRVERLSQSADGSGSVEAELASGILQHFDDDDSFHKSPVFYETIGELIRLFREHWGDDDAYRSGFLGHIVAELILDAILIERNPDLLDGYYDVISKLDSALIENEVNRLARRPTSRLSAWIPLFAHEQFLRDYREPHRLLFRLNQVMRRIKLKQLPDDFGEALSAAWPIVKRRAPRLLPGFGL